MKEKYILPLAGIILLLIFIFLGFLVRFKPECLSGFDNYFTEITRNNFYPAFNSFFSSITQLGGYIFVVIITIFISIMLFINKKRAASIWLFSGLMITGILVQLLKMIVDRQRPILPHLVTANSMSFPSGHSTAAMVLYGALIILIGIYIKNRLLSIVFQLLLAILIFSIWVSRIYTGAHFPSDIIGSFLLGGAWLSITYRIYRRYENS